MAASKYNLSIEAGATFRLKMVWKDATGVPVDLTGCSAKLQVRKKVSDITEIVTITSPDSIILGAAGAIEIVIRDDVTSTLVDGVYDMEITHPAVGLERPDVTRLLYGSVTVSKNVTR